jgi:hypothetical protein
MLAALEAAEIRFIHPTWPDDPNDPSTATRVNEQKVRG